MTGQRIGVYPGTFDPVTNGHLDIIRRTARVVDHLIVAVAANGGKGPLFTLSERIGMLREEVAAFDDDLAGRFEARAFDTLLMNFADEVGAEVIVRGLRAVSDFDYEFQMAGMNARLNPNVETVFLMASERHQFISSRFVKEIARLGGDISSFVSPRVAERVRARVAEGGAAPADEKPGKVEILKYHSKI